MTTEEINKGNKLIEQLMGIKVKPHKKKDYEYHYEFWTPEGTEKQDVFFGVLKEDDPTYQKLIYQCIVSRVKFHSSWDWLVPAYSKVQLDHVNGDELSLLQSRFEEAIYTNSVNIGFEALVIYLKWYNNQRKE